MSTIRILLDATKPRVQIIGIEPNSEISDDVVFLRDDFYDNELQVDIELYYRGSLADAGFTALMLPEWYKSQWGKQYIKEATE